MRFGTSDYVGTGTTPANFQLWGVTLLPPSSTQHCHIMSLFSYFFFFVVLAHPHKSDPFTDFDRSCVKTCLLVQGSAFWGLELKKNIFTPKFGGKTRNSSQKSQCALSNYKIEQKGSKWRFFGQDSTPYMFYGTGNPNLRSILKPEVELKIGRASCRERV